MSNYRKQILSEIFVNNHINPINTIYLKTRNFTKLNFNNSISVNMYTNLRPGLYSIIINSISYFFILDEETELNDKLYIHNIYNAYVIHNNIKKNIIIYAQSNNITEPVKYYTIDAKSSGLTYDEQSKLLSANNAIYDSSSKLIMLNGTASVVSLYEIKNTVESFLDGIIVEGETIYNTKNIDNPCDLQSINSIIINTYNGPESDELKILLKNPIKRLPCGICDLFFMDSIYCNAFTIHNIGRTILSGSEPWEILNDYCNSDYNVFFYNCSNIAIGTNKDFINCCSLNSVAFNNLASSGTSICMGNSESSRGIYIKIQKQYAQDLQEFKNFLRKQILNYKPFIVEYLLDKPIYKSVLLDEYHVKTFFKNTNIKINANNTTFLTRNFK